MLEARATVRNLKEYHPPLGGRTGLRLDFNENTVGCSPRVLERLHQMTPEEMARYPEREPVERVVAQFLGLDPAEVLLTNGVDEGIHLLCETYLDPGDEVLIAVPTFAMYEVYAQATGATVITVPSGPELRFPTQEMLARITPRTRLITVANPNNPTGAAVASSDLLRLADSAPDAALLVDEAYYEFHGESMIAELRNRPNLFVARTFSKAYGMAGLRLGVLAGGAQLLRTVRRVGSPYNVNAAALACLPVALADAAYVSEYAAQARSGRERLQRELSRTGVKFWPSRANFVLAFIGERRQELVEAMRQRGILLRDRSSDPGCYGCVRITVGPAAQMDRLLEALREVLPQIGILRTPAPGEVTA